MPKIVPSVPIIPAPGYFPYDDGFKSKFKNSPRKQRDEWDLCKHNFKHFCYNWVYIIGMDGFKQLFKFNPIQEQYHIHQTRDDIILKSRKVGISTYKVIQGLWATMFNAYRKGVVLCHEMSSTEELYKIFTTAYDNLPEWLRATVTKRTSEKMIFGKSPFDEELNSDYQIGTAGSVDFGHGYTVDFIHLSEYSRYSDPMKIKKGMGQTRRRDGKSVLSLESTANGLNDFESEWAEAEKGTSSLKPHFFPWTQDSTCIETPWRKMMDNLTIEDKAYFDRLHCTPEQIAFYLTKRDRERLGVDGTHEQYPSLPGEAFVSTSRGVFDAEVLARVEQELNERHKRLTLEGNPPIAELREDGHLTIWKLPKQGWHYVIGADCSKGKAKGDFSCATVLDGYTGEEVAELHGRWAPEIFARKLNDLGKMYNTAILAVEKDLFGTSVLERLVMEHDYQNMFQDWQFDKATGKRTPELGWVPTNKSKPQIIIIFQNALREGTVIPNSIQLLRECKTYVHLTGKKIGADQAMNESGEPKRDDRVISMALAVYVMHQNPWIPVGTEQSDARPWRDRWFANEGKKLKEDQLAEADALRDHQRELEEYITDEVLTEV